MGAKLRKAVIPYIRKLKLRKARKSEVKAGDIATGPRDVFEQSELQSALLHARL
jgi:hypothetical protein